MKNALCSLILTLSLTVSCNQNAQQSKISFALRGAIDSYLEQTKATPFCDKTIKVLTIGIKNVGDTSVVKVMNSYPRIKHFNLVGYATYNGYDLYILGDDNDDLFRTEHSMADIVDKLENRDWDRTVAHHPCKLSYIYAHKEFTMKTK